MKVMKVAVFQGPADSADFLPRLAGAAARASGADLLVCPEMAATGYNIGEAAEDLAEQADGPTARRVAEICRAHGLAIAYGYPERALGTVHNCVQLIDATGRALANYRKTHLFGELDKAHFSPGDRAVVQTRLRQHGTPKVVVEFDALSPSGATHSVHRPGGTAAEARRTSERSSSLRRTTHARHLSTDPNPSPPYFALFSTIMGVAADRTKIIPGNPCRGVRVGSGEYEEERLVASPVQVLRAAVRLYQRRRGRRGDHRAGALPPGRAGAGGRLPADEADRRNPVRCLGNAVVRAGHDRGRSRRRRDAADGCFARVAEPRGTARPPGVRGRIRPPAPQVRRRGLGLGGFTMCLLDAYTGARWRELVGQQRHEYDPEGSRIRICAPLKEVSGKVFKGGSLAMRAEGATSHPTPTRPGRRRRKGKKGRTMTPAGTRWGPAAEHRDVLRPTPPPHRPHRRRPRHRHRPRRRNRHQPSPPPAHQQSPATTLP
ncbi:nitrilase-related carbon-nitrogen hydrolase [Amycolatopsis albispora]|uniref:nitrilase-related carbon-nitrogen hydrolase n=1 Tax=Amycolatopsis albispora TaxID=1804986 RepID=UPI001F15C86D|nr:nitrilase-related carbon-nitrogen hydrolase [Amycolatopsis albispora]